MSKVFKFKFELAFANQNTQTYTDWSRNETKQNKKRIKNQCVYELIEHLLKKPTNQQTNLCTQTIIQVRINAILIKYLNVSLK